MLPPEYFAYQKRIHGRVQAAEDDFHHTRNKLIQNKIDVDGIYPGVPEQTPKALVIKALNKLSFDNRQKLAYLWAYMTYYGIDSTALQRVARTLADKRDPTTGRIPQAWIYPLIHKLPNLMNHLTNKLIFTANGVDIGNQNLVPKARDDIFELQKKYTRVLAKATSIRGTPRASALYSNNLLHGSIYSQLRILEEFVRYLQFLSRLNNDLDRQSAVHHNDLIDKHIKELHKNVLSGSAYFQQNLLNHLIARKKQLEDTARIHASIEEIESGP